MRRSSVLVAGAVLLAGGAAILGHRGDSSPAAKVHGAPLDPPPEEVAAFGKLAEEAKVPLMAAPAVAKAAAKIPAASAALADQLDLDKIALAGDHYEATLKDGRRAVLTLDPGLQELAEKLLDESRAPRGAIVAMAPDGRILALAGRRTEEPKGSRDGTPDWHLATDVWAPAASVFKLVTASALVKAGVDPDDKICFHGGVRSVMESNLRDDKHDSRCESLSFGVAHSNNAILGKLAYQKLEPAALAKTAADLALSSALPGTDIHGMTGEMALPTAHDLAFAKSAAGFEGSRLSVIGGALLAATFADDGEQPVPRLVASIDGVEQPVAKPRRALSASIARSVGRMMEATCELGSASKSFGKRSDVRVAGKTGTLATSTPFYMEHSWFVGYAPYEKPEIIVSVLLGNPESWHLRGHEAARRMIDRAVRREKDRTAKAASAKRVQW